MKSTRILWVDIAKFICIMCVMNTHLESATDALRMFYTPFFLTLFFFCSGYTYRQEPTFKGFFTKKVRQLFVPWLIYSVANILLSSVISFNAHMPLWEELSWNFAQIRGLGDGLWFVAALFVAFIPFYFFIGKYEKSTHPSRDWLLLGVALALSLLSSIYDLVMDPALFPWNASALPWHIEYIFIAMFFMVLGYLYRTKWEAKLEKFNCLACCIAAWALYLAVIFIGEMFIQNLSIKMLWTYGEQLLGIAAVILLCKRLPAGKMVLYIGQNTLLCFALHGKVYSVLQTLFRKFIPGLYGTILNSTLLSSVFSIFLTILLSVILIVPIWFINRWLPFTVGRKKAQIKKSAE